MKQQKKEYQWDKIFDIQTELEEIHRVQKIQRKKRLRFNKIDEFRGELGELYNAGISFAGLTIWLRSRKKITISRSSVYRIMCKWPEIHIRRYNDA
jgi:hypothetical protein